jgi:nucleoside phosphorylase
VRIARIQRRPSFRLRRVAVALLAACACACGGGDDQAPAPIAVLSAFPGETTPLLAQASVGENVTINGRVFRRGTLGGVPVVLGFTGIGLANAALTTRAVLERFGVAGSTLQIGDVTVPIAWELSDGTAYAASQTWLDLAQRLAGTFTLERCTMVPSLSPEPVCMPQQPALVVGGVGRSSDPFNGQAFPCQPNGDDLYGCDVPAEAASAGASVTFAPRAAAAAIVNDMETAAIAREAAMRGVPFIAFRAVSDGSGDPLGLPQLSGQFPAYYPFAARNAAVATVAFLQRLRNQRP